MFHLWHQLHNQDDYKHCPILKRCFPFSGHTSPKEASSVLLCVKNTVTSQAQLAIKYQIYT